MSKEYFYNIKIDKNYPFKSERKFGSEDEIIEYALSCGILDVDDGDPYDSVDWAGEVSEEAYSNYLNESL